MKKTSEWVISLDPAVENKRSYYAEKLRRQYHLTAAKSDHYTESEAAWDRYQDFIEFGKKIDRLQEGKRDPRKKLDACIDIRPECFVLSAPPWQCYFYCKKQIAIGVLLFHSNEAPRDLKEAFVEAANSWQR